MCSITSENSGVRCSSTGVPITFLVSKTSTPSSNNLVEKSGKFTTTWREPKSKFVHLSLSKATIIDASLSSTDRPISENVAGPAIPSGANPCLSWNNCTALRRFPSYMSDELRFKYPLFINALRRSTTLSPLSPGRKSSLGSSLYQPP